MKKLILFAAVAGLGLVSAAPPGAAPAPAGTRAAGGYPPCSRTVTDRCIQLHERGVRTAANLAKNRRLGPEQGVATASAAPAPRAAAPVRLARNDYRRCSHGTRRGCYQRYERG
ncbi:MAG TPA: hypothetical protein VF727_05570 [Allosphingosinicella sp.]